MLFDYLIPQRIIFGPGTIGRLGDETSKLGTRALLVTGRNSLRASGMIDRILQPLEAATVEVVAFDQVTPEPSLSLVEAGLELGRLRNVDLVIGVGGGSALDVAKTVAGLYRAPGSVLEYFDGKPVAVRGIPWLAVPTTAGSGAEATRNAVLTDPVAGKKQSLRSEEWLASTVIVDPALTMSLPPKITAESGMDALTHAIESYTSRTANPLTDHLSLQAAVMICRKLFTVYRDGHNRESREQVALGSLMAGIALNNARLGAVHGLAHPIGYRYHLAHGLVCGVLLPYVMEYNLLTAEDKYARIARELDLATAQDSAAMAAGELLHFIKVLRSKLKLPDRLGEVGLQVGDIPSLAEDSLSSGSLAANPKPAGYHDLVAILEANI